MTNPEDAQRLANPANDTDQELATDDVPVIPVEPQAAAQASTENGDSDGQEEESDEDEDEDEDEEPHLKYARLTQHLGSVYRNGDATSAFLVAGDKMIIGTHNGNIHVVQLPMFQTLRVYHAHSASVTSISISPFPPPLPTEKPEVKPTQEPTSPEPKKPEAPNRSQTKRSREPPQIPKTPSNDIYIATSSVDGNVCVQSLVDMKDVALRNFARPIQAVAMSPDYKTDRTYLSGGKAGQLILTAGAPHGRSTSTTTGTAAATASGWLGSVGLGANTGKDTIIHTGEGAISNIKWSLSGKYVVWLNEHGIKIMRSNLHLDSADSDDAWKRIGHIDRPQTEEWDLMASSWKGRVDWIDEQAFQADDTAEPEKSKSKSVAKKVERLLVGWGGTIWIIHVHPGGIGTGRNVGEKTLGRAAIVKILRMDCIISGISLYTQNLLLVLAFCTPDEDESEDEAPKGHKSKLSTASSGSQPSGGIRRRQNNPPPELRLIDLDSQVEVDKDGLNVSRYERLAAGDYHLSVLPARNAASAVASSRGALEVMAGIGTGMWNAAINPTSIFSSGASIRSRESDDAASIRPSRTGQSVHPSLLKEGAKIFIHSPYDCILGTKRDQADHLSWLLEREQYQQAWELLERNPDILTDELPRDEPILNDDESIAESVQRNIFSSVEQEKRRIGELWIQELIDEGDWKAAGRVCGKVLNTPDRWEKWVGTFASSNHHDEIVDYVPSELSHPPLPRQTYETLLLAYIQKDKPRFKELLDRWSTDLFDINTVTTTLENQLKYRDVREDSIEDGEKGRDWRIVMDSLAGLHEANGRHREALKCYIKLQDADSAFRLIRDSHLAEAVADDIPGFIGLKVPTDKIQDMSPQDVEEATSEPITLLVDEAQHGLVRPEVVVEQLQAKSLLLYLHLYFRGLWRGEGVKEHTGENRDRLLMDSQSLVDDFADLAVHIFATYDRALLIEFLRSSTSYSFEKAVHECKEREYWDELVFLLSKMGEMKQALFLIIDRLRDARKAIEFAKEQDDPDLWEDLLGYSMDKPSFIRGLLEQVGTAIDPIKLVKRIPEGLEIPGLREGLTHMMKEHEIQYSISSGVARVLRSEVATAQNELRSGQRRGIKFDVATEEEEEKPQMGFCANCQEEFTEWETETLVGYACGHAFHVSHLLEMLHKGRRVDVDLGSTEERSRYSVGVKVMTARLLRDKVQGGCPVCKVKEG